MHDILVKLVGKLKKVFPIWTAKQQSKSKKYLWMQSPENHDKVEKSIGFKK